jgi:uncharacterized protein involved in exopolysaccharide biosynthesis
MIAGIHQAITLPKIYRASTLILIEPQSVPQDFVRSIVTAKIDSRINTIQQQILSRTNLEKIIRDFNLFLGPGFENVFMENKIEILRNRIKVTVTEDRQRETNAFSISYKGKHPETVMRVANGLATYFIDENLKVREAQAIGTSDFLEDELIAIKKKLIETEKKVRDYRQQYMGELPEQLETSLRIIDRLQMQLNEKQTTLRDEKNRLTILESQIKESQKLAAAEDGPLDVETSTDLKRLRLRLEDMRSRYTDSHPDVIRLTNRIKELEAGLSNEDQKTTGSTVTLGSRGVPMGVDFKSQRKAILI